MFINFKKLTTRFFKIISTISAVGILIGAFYYESNVEDIEEAQYKTAIENSLSKITDDRANSYKTIDACISGIPIRGISEFRLLWQKVDSNGTFLRCEGTTFHEMKQLGITYVKYLCVENSKMLEITIIGYKEQHRWRFYTRDKCEQ